MIKESIRNWLTQEFGSDEALINELYAQYAADMRSRATGLHAYFVSGNVTALGEEGHAMKGMALQMGDRELSELCLRLQNSGRAGDQAGCAPLIEAICVAVAAL